MDPELAAAVELCRLRALVQSIQSALGTEENWEALVEVARHAHSAEMRLARIDRLLEEMGLAARVSVREAS